VRAGWLAVPTSWCITPICPSIVIVPVLGRVSPVISFSNVVLPTPFAPMMAVRSPLPTRNPTSWKSSSPPGRRQARWLTVIAPTGERAYEVWPDGPVPISTNVNSSSPRRPMLCRARF
jgi:hypothetical protein